MGDPDTKSKGEYFCGATVVADRWVVAASHCYDDFRNGVTDGPRRVRVNTIRDNTPYKELVEIKRVYKHPNYRFPNLYNDVAVLELGRRIEYNFTKFGDSPSCLPKKEFEVINKIATVQGYGVTESGTKGDLLETNVTVITNKYCKEILQANVTKDQNNAKKILKALPLGLDYGLMCAQGIFKEDKNIYTGSCKGDSGGPLTQRDEQDRTTLIGIVSGGIDCGKGYPGWYTRVEYYKEWIQCIIDKSIQFNNNYDKVHTNCAQLERTPRKQPDCKELVADVDVSLFDLRDIGATPEEICEPYETGSFARGDDEDAEIFGDPNVQFSAGGGGKYENKNEGAVDQLFGDAVGADDEIFGGGDETGGDDEIFGADDEIFGDDYAGGDADIFS